MKYYIAKNIGKFYLSFEEAIKHTNKEDIQEIEEMYIVRVNCNDIEEYIFSTKDKAIDFVKKIALDIINNNEENLYKDSNETINNVNFEIDKYWSVDMNKFIKWNYDTIAIYVATVDSEGCAV